VPRLLNRLPPAHLYRWASPHRDLPAVAQRSSDGASNTEILFAIGAGPQVVGAYEFSDYPGGGESLPSIGGSMGQYSYEQVAALKPDLVLASEINTPEQVKALEDLGLTVYYLSNPKSLEDLYIPTSRPSPNLTGRETEAAALVESLKARVKAVDDKLVGVTENRLSSTRSTPPIRTSLTPPAPAPSSICLLRARADRIYQDSRMRTRKSAWSRSS